MSTHVILLPPRNDVNGLTFHVFAANNKVSFHFRYCILLTKSLVGRSGDE